jgi:hypothetical protein
MRAQKTSEAASFQKELWRPLDGNDLVFEVVEEAFIKDSLKIKAKSR